MNASSLSVSVWVQMVLFTGIALPVDAPPAEEPQPTSLVGDLTDHPLLPQFEIPVLIHRSEPDLLGVLPSTFSCVRLNKPMYEIQHFTPSAKFHFVPLDNPPTGDSGWVTSIREARATQRKIGKDGVFIPLDWFTFVEMIEDENQKGRDVAFVKEVHSKYGRYEKVIILFTDPIQFGENQEDYHLIWERKDPDAPSIFTVVSADKLVSLQNGETVLSVCVLHDEVITRPDFNPLDGVEVGADKDARIVLADDSRNLEGASPAWNQLIAEVRKSRPKARSDPNQGVLDLKT